MAWASLPPVTVQLPLYNERYVVERLIDAVAALNYPLDKLEIQVLDDSTDDSIELSRQKVAACQQRGINIRLIQRPERVGFKAGALAYGLDRAQGEFVAIFDADFVPDPDFLLKTVPHFSNPKVGIVQTRWTHLNEDHSLLTQLQAFGLNAHFFIEQGGRNAADLFGANKRFSTRAAGAAIRSPKTLTSATGRSFGAGSSFTAKMSGRPPNCPWR